MEILPKLNITRFAQLTAGDLFICTYEAGACVAMKVEDPIDADPLMLLLGPAFPPEIDHPRLVGAPSVTVISYGSDYVLRLPADPSGWTAEEPQHSINCILITGSEAYFRGNGSPTDRAFHACYVNVATGRLHASGNGPNARYAKPAGIRAFANTWSIVTTEAKPRVILAYPYQ